MTWAWPSPGWWWRCWCPAGEPVTVAIDDTLFRRRGQEGLGRVMVPRRVRAGTGENGIRQHLGDRRGRGEAADCSAGPVAIPVLAKLVIKGTSSASRLWLARRMTEMLAGALPGRDIHVVADSAYAGGELKKLPRPGDLDHPAAQGRRPARPPARAHRPARPAPDQGRPAALPGRARRHRRVHPGHRHPLRQDRRHQRRRDHLPVALGLRHQARHRRADPRPVHDRLRPGPGHHRYRRHRRAGDRTLRQQVVASRSRSRTPGRSSAPGRPATAPPAPSSGPSRSSSPARPSPPAGTPPPATTPPTWPITGPAPPGTPARPSRRPPTWPPSSAASSSPPDLRHLALTSQHPKKSASSAWPGKTSPHNYESRVTCQNELY